MSTFDFIVGLDTHLVLETDYFVSQLKSRWPDARVHFIADENAHSLLQWRVDADIYVLGDFSQGGITFQAHGEHDFAQVVIWFRKIVPPEQHLIYYQDSLTVAFEITSTMTEQEIIDAYLLESDDDPIEKFIDRMPD